MNTFAEIQTAVEYLSLPEKERLLRILSVPTPPAFTKLERSRAVRVDGDVLLEAPASSPPMTPEIIKQMLGDWP